MIYYQLDFATTSYNEIGILRQDLLPEESTKTGRVSSENFIYCLQANNSLSLYQVVRYTDSQSYIIPIREISLAKKNKTLYDFDIFDEKYFVLYSGERDIEVYIIKNEIEIEYKMKLPLYRQF